MTYAPTASAPPPHTGDVLIGRPSDVIANYRAQGWEVITSTHTQTLLRRGKEVLKVSWGDRVDPFQAALMGDLRSDMIPR